MKSQRTTRLPHHVLALCSLFGVACDVPPGPGEEVKPPGRTTPPATAVGEDASREGIYGKLLYRQISGADHTIEFYDFGGAGTGVRESLSMDSGETEILGKLGNFTSLTEAYLKLNPGAREVPAAILAADRRAPALHPLSGQSASPAYTTSTSPATEAILSAAQTTCSEDVFGDNWGSQWFLDNFCNAGNFRNCPTNLGNFDSGVFRSPDAWASYRQMEGDFNVAGHIRGWYWPCTFSWLCGRLQVFVDRPVPPRQVEVWGMVNQNNRYQFTGSSPCNHLHAAVLRR